MDVINFILLLLAIICFTGAAFGIERHPRMSLLALGLAFWVAVPLIAAGQAL